MDDFMVRITNDYLKSSYDETGVIRWWQRDRTELKGMSPIEAVSEGHYELVEDLASELL